MKIGLVGLPACGKSHVSKLLSEKGFRVIDADKVSHQALKQPIIGKCVLDTFGTTDRYELAEIVFKDKQKLLSLEKILYRWVVGVIEVELVDGSEDVVLEAPLLFKTNLIDYLDQVWLIEAPLDVRMKRAQGRGWTEEQLAERDRHLIPLIDENRDKINAVIQNDGNSQIDISNYI